MFFYRGVLLTFEVDNVHVALPTTSPTHLDEEQQAVSMHYLADLAMWVSGNEERKRMHQLERTLISHFAMDLVSLGHRELLSLEDPDNLIHLSVRNRMCQIARFWDSPRDTRLITLLTLGMGPKRATNVLRALRKKVWINRCASRSLSIQDTAESIRFLIRDIVEERRSGIITVDEDEVAEAAVALSRTDAFVVSYQHQTKGPGLTPVADRLCEEQIMEIATTLTDHGMSKANEVHLAFDFTSLVGAQCEKENVSWASTGLDVFKVARVIYVSASRNRPSDWCQIELYCALLYGSAIATDPQSDILRELGSKIEFEKAELLLAEVLVSNVVEKAGTTMWVEDVEDLRRWAVSVLDTVHPKPNGIFPMLEAVASEGSVRDEEETWISLIANAGAGLLGNFRELKPEDKDSWEYHPNFRKWRDVGVSKIMMDHARRVDEVLWGAESIESNKRYDYLFYNDTTEGCKCFLVMTNELSGRRHAWLIQGSFRLREKQDTRLLWVAAVAEKLCPYNVLRALEWDYSGDSAPLNELCQDLGMRRWGKSKQVNHRDVF